MNVCVAVSLVDLTVGLVDLTVGLVFLPKIK